MRIEEINFDMPINLIIAQERMPYKFSQCSFDNYMPDEEYPSQRDVKEKLEKFVYEVERFNTKKCCGGIIGKITRKRLKPKHVYIDGGFGIGKTHLLSSIGNAYPGRKIFLSFSELMYLIAYFDLLPLVEKISRFDLMLLDEFELDDPGDAMMGINFIRELSSTNTIVAATSNTTPVSLGGRKFDMLLFKERIGSLIDYFQTFAIDGKDYRIKKLTKVRHGSSKKTLMDLFKEYKTGSRDKLYVGFDDLLKKMRDVHPVRYINFNESIDAVFIENLRKFTDDELLDALRFTYLIDVLYYGSVDIFISTDIQLWDMFSDDLKDGKFRNKIMRCLSRLSEKGVFVDTNS